VSISEKERALLRDLSLRVAETAADPIQRQNAELWKKLNRLERTRPMIRLQDGTQHETGHKVNLECESEFARTQELDLRGRIYRWEKMRDDTVWDDIVCCPIVIHCTDFGIREDATRPNRVFGASRYNTVIMDDESPDRIPLPTVTVDWEQTERDFRRLCDLYDGILTVRKVGMAGYGFEPVDTFIRWRGIEQTFIDMVDRPEWLHGWLQRLCDWHLSHLEQCEKLGLLSLNNGNVGVGRGGPGFTDELPMPDFDGEHVRAKDLWGYAATQIFAEVSPAMHEEFALQYEKRLLDRFGLACYGCCEPLDLKIDILFKHIPHLRRVSMSPWVDVARGAENLGKRAIFSYKPNPAILGVEHWDVGVARELLRDALEKTRECIVEVTMKDLHTVRGEVHRMTEWIEMAKELAEEYA